MTPVILLSTSSTISPTSYRCSVIYLSLSVILFNSSFVEAVINGLNLNAPVDSSNEAANIIPFLTFLNKSCAFLVLANEVGRPFLNESKSFAFAAALILLALIPVAPSASGSLSPALATLILSKSYRPCLLLTPLYFFKIVSNSLTLSEPATIVISE